MTATDQPATSADDTIATDVAPDPIEPLGTRQIEAPPVVRRRRIDARQRRLTYGLALTTVVGLLLLVGLVALGYRTSLKIGGGTSDRVTDPAAPGYGAEPEPTPVDLYVLTTTSGAYAGGVLMVPNTSGEGGTAVPIPPSFVLPETDGAIPLPANEVWSAGGLDELANRLGIALGARIGSAEQVDADTFAQMIGAEAVTIDNPDNLIERAEDGTPTVRYPAGELTLSSEELLDFLAFTGADDPAPNQAIRAEAVYDQVFQRAATSELADLPVGEQSPGSESPGFGPVLAAHLAGDSRFERLPLQKVPIPGTIYTVWMLDPTVLSDFVVGLIPLPQSPVPGMRLPVAVLNGATDPDTIRSVLPTVVRAGGEVVLVGNADAFDVTTTRVEYSAQEVAPVAEQIAEELGVTAVKLDEQIPDASVRVVVGSDG